MQAQMDLAGMQAPAITSPTLAQPAPTIVPPDVPPTTFLQVEGMVTAEVLADDEEYHEVGLDGHEDGCHHSICIQHAIRLL